MSDLHERFRNHPVVATMSDEHISTLLECDAHIISFEPDSLIVEDGKPADACYFIESGDVAVELFLGGSQKRTVQTVDAGDIVGWSWLSPPYQWNFDAVAVTSVTALRVDAALLRDAMETDRTMGYEMMKRFCEVIVSRLNASRYQILDLYRATDADMPRRTAFASDPHA